MYEPEIQLFLVSDGTQQIYKTLCWHLERINNHQGNGEFSGATKEKQFLIPTYSVYIGQTCFIPCEICTSKYTFLEFNVRTQALIKMNSSPPLCHWSHISNYGPSVGARIIRISIIMRKVPLPWNIDPLKGWHYFVLYHRYK